MFKARGTRPVGLNGTRPAEPVRSDLRVEPGLVSTVDVQEPDATADTVSPRSEAAAAEAQFLQVDGQDAAELARVLGMPPAFPELPGNFADTVRAAIAGDLASIQEMRRIGDMVPVHLQVAFAELVEQMLDESA